MASQARPLSSSTYGQMDPQFNHNLDDYSLKLSVQVFVPPNFEYLQKKIRLHRIFQSQFTAGVFGAFLYYEIFYSLIMPVNENKLGFEGVVYLIRNIIIILQLILGFCAAAFYNIKLQRLYMKAWTIVQIAMCVDLAIAYIAVLAKLERDIEPFFKIPLFFAYMAFAVVMRLQSAHVFTYYSLFQDTRYQRSPSIQPISLPPTRPKDVVEDDDPKQQAQELKNVVLKVDVKEFNSDTASESNQPQGDGDSQAEQQEEQKETAEQKQKQEAEEKEKKERERQLYKKWQFWKNMKIHLCIQAYLGAFVLCWFTYGWLYLARNNKHEKDQFREDMVSGEQSIIMSILAMLLIYNAVKKNSLLETVGLVYAAATFIYIIIDDAFLVKRKIQDDEDNIVPIIYNAIGKLAICGFSVLQGCFLRTEFQKINQVFK